MGLGIAPNEQQVGANGIDGVGYPNEVRDFMGVFGLLVWNFIAFDWDGGF